MAEIQRNKRGGNGMLHDRDIELEEFKEMKTFVNDMLANSFDTGIIKHEDRVVLQKLLRDLTDVIQILEMKPHESDISSRYLSGRKADTRGRYRQLKEAFDDNRRTPDAYTERYTSNSTPFQETVPSDSDNVSSNTYDTGTPNWEINYGYNDDDKHNKSNETNENNVFNETSVNNNQRHGKESDKIEGVSPQKSNRLKGLQKTTFQNRENISYIGDAKYFVDDEEETKMLAVVGDDNWTLLNPNLSQSFTVLPKSNTNIGQSNDQLCEQALSIDKLSYSSNDIYKRNNLTQNANVTENLSDRNANKNNHRYDNDVIDCNVSVTLGGTAPEKIEYREDDIKHALKGFDYLDEIESEGNDNPIVSCAVNEENGIREDDIKHVLKGFDYLDEINENNDDAVNDALSDFNYLDKLHEIKDDGIKNALEKFDYLDDIDENKSSKASTGSQEHSKDDSTFSGNTRRMNDSCREFHVSETDLRQESKDYLYCLDKTFVSTPNVSKRIFDEDKLEFKKLSGKDFAEAVSNSKDEGGKSIYLYQGEYNTYGQKESNTRTTATHMLPRIYRSNIYYNTDDKYAGHMDRTRSQEIVPSFTAGEFILRKTQSEDIHHPLASVRHKERPDLETLTEERFSTFTDTQSIEYAGKGSFQSSSCNVCSFIIKGLMVLVFCLAAAKITLGVVFRDTCQVEEIVPICVIASGSLSICFCLAFLGLYFLRKRFGQILRSFRIFFVFTWVIIFGVIIAGCVLLYPSIKDYAFGECSGHENCCSRKLTLTAFGAIITDLICQLCFFIIICCAK